MKDHASSTFNRVKTAVKDRQNRENTNSPSLSSGSGSNEDNSSREVGKREAERDQFKNPLDD